MRKLGSRQRVVLARIRDMELTKEHELYGSDRRVLERLRSLGLVGPTHRFQSHFGITDMGCAILAEASAGEDT